MERETASRLGGRFAFKGANFWPINHLKNQDFEAKKRCEL
jgi:hypothetical protein